LAQRGSLESSEVLVLMLLPFFTLLIKDIVPNLAVKQFLMYAT